MNQELRRFHGRLLVVTVVLAWFIVKAYGTREDALRSAHVRWLAAQNVVWAQDDSARAINLAEQTGEREKVYADELRHVFSGPLSEATKNPELDIRQMLHEAAIACAPAGTKISVSVDRFTEFDIAMVLPQPLSVERLAVIAQSLLRHTSPYVHSLRFIHGNNLLAYLGVDEIAGESWSTVPLKTVAWRLTDAGKAGQTGTASDATLAQDDTPPAEEATPAQVAIGKAQADFKIDCAEHIRQLNSLMQRLNRAGQLAGIQSHHEFVAQMKSLDEAESDLAGLRTFFMDQSADLVLLLRDDGVDPLLVPIYQRGVDDDNRQEAPIFEELFAALSTQLQQTREGLTAMDTYRGQWSIDTDSSRIQFTTAQAQDAYVNETSQVQSSARRVREAISEISNFKPVHAAASSTR